MKYLISFVLTILACGAFADTKSDDILRKLSAKLNSYGSYSVGFNFEINGVTAGRGTYEVSGDKFYIKVLENIVFSDGKNRYEVNSEDKEITIDAIDLNDKSMLSNPAKAFELVGDNFRSTYGGVVERAGKRCDMITLVPQVKDSGFNDVKIWINTADNLPVAVEYRIEGTPKPVVIVLTRVERKAVDKALFEY